MILLHHIVQVLGLTDLDLSAGLLLERLNGGRIGSALVDYDLLRKAVLANCFLEEAQRGFPVVMGRQEKVDSLPLFVNGAVKIFSRPLDLDIGILLANLQRS